MRTRRVTGALVALGFAVALAPLAGAEPSGKCGGGLFAFSSSGAAVCVTNGPVQGSIEARQTGGGNFYVVADGDSGNAALPTNCLDGYAGVQFGGGYEGVVFGPSGDYQYGPQPAPGPPAVPPC